MATYVHVDTWIYTDSVQFDKPFNWLFVYFVGAVSSKRVPSVGTGPYKLRPYSLDLFAHHAIS